MRYFDKASTYSLRGGVILLIVIHHIYQMLNKFYNIQFDRTVSLLLDNIGYWCTSIFFLLSGFGVFCSLSKIKIDQSYVISHLIKLLKPFLFIWLLNVICASVYEDGNSLSYFHDLFTLSFHYGDSLWFMKMIFIIYLVVFLIYFIIHERYRITLMFVLTLLYIIWAYYRGFQSFWYNSILCFPVGMLCASKIDNLQKVKSFSLFIISFIVFFVSFTISKSFHAPIYSLYDIVAEVFACVSGVSISLLAIAILKNISIKSVFLNQCGKYTLLIYLTHVSLLSFFIFIKNPYWYLFCVLLLMFIVIRVYSFLDVKVCIK